MAPRKRKSRTPNRQAPRSGRPETNPQQKPTPRREKVTKKGRRKQPLKYRNNADPTPDWIFPPSTTFPLIGQDDLGSRASRLRGFPGRNASVNERGDRADKGSRPVSTQRREGAKTPRKHLGVYSVSGIKVGDTEHNVRRHLGTKFTKTDDPETGTDIWTYDFPESGNPGSTSIYISRGKVTKIISAQQVC